MKFPFGGFTVMNRWLAIASIFIVQVIGMIFIISMFKLPKPVFVLPGAILGAGAVFSLIVWRYPHPSRLPNWLYWVPAILYSTFIFLLSHRSFSNVSLSFSTNFFHPIEYSVFAVFLCWAWYPVRAQKGNLNYCVRVFLTGLLYGCLDEIHQFFVPGRNPSLIDLSLDALGLGLGMAFMHMFGPLISSNSSVEQSQKKPQQDVSVYSSGNIIHDDS